MTAVVYNGAMVQYFNGKRQVTEDEFLKAVKAEVIRARLHHPAPNANLYACQEEVGEVAEAAMDEPWHTVVNEAVQACAMLIRLVTEGDATLLDWRMRHARLPTGSGPGGMPIVGISQEQLTRAYGPGNLFHRSSTDDHT
mgnify:FL=1